MLNEAALLAASPDYVSVGAFFKATPVTVGSRRFVYFEASREGTDQEGETILAKALADSAEFYKKYGNVDIDHITLLGAKMGVKDYLSYEIGRPIEVIHRGKSIFAKAELYAGEGPMAFKANMVWDSMTTLRPATHWYPSVAGQALEKHIELDPQTHEPRVLIKKLRWISTALSKTPVNQHVDACAVVPMGAFAKCWTSGGLDIAKALTAGYGTDSASLTGGAALREQSLYGAHSERVPVLNYFDFRNRLAGDVQSKRVGAGGTYLIEHAISEYGMPRGEAAEHVERFMRDLHAGLERGTVQ